MGSTFIKEIVLNGFKSFGDKKVTITLERGFTAISGPNGSGKSNFIEGLCFALGWLDKEKIHAYYFRDLIFVGTKTKKPADLAEVQVVFDNSENVFPEYMGYDLIISREITQKNKSIYRLNGKPCNQENILAILALAKIDYDRFNIIFQGTLGKLTYFTPKERCAFIQNFAGVQKSELVKMDLLESIESIDLEKMRKFTHAFNEINLHFNEIYSKFSPGGIAKMMLENPVKPLESGVVIEARPNGKKITSMEALSGGEKTILTLSFILAIWRAQPSPFYVMDEIDAALDAPIARQVFKVIKDFTAFSQIIVTSRFVENLINADMVYNLDFRDSISDIFLIKKEDLEALRAKQKSMDDLIKENDVKMQSKKRGIKQH